MDRLYIHPRIRVALQGMVLGLGLAAGAALAAAPAPGGPAPAFTLPDLIRAKHDVSLKSLQGKVVALDFWASWCPPCRKTLPQLGAMRARHPDLVVLAVSIDEKRANALEFVKSRDSSLVFLHDAKRAVASEYDLGGMPSLVLIDRKGTLRYRHDGYTEGDAGKIEAEIKKLMEEP
ncbi:MAG: Thioredoxin-like protein [Fibrobacteres bacterium]|nr:Thioredoxin-like protein [Fibrobacterota bacterium]